MAFYLALQNAVCGLCFIICHGPTYIPRTLFSYWSVDCAYHALIPEYRHHNDKNGVSDNKRVQYIR